MVKQINLKINWDIEASIWLSDRKKKLIYKNFKWIYFSIRWSVNRNVIVISFSPEWIQVEQTDLKTSWRLPLEVANPVKQSSENTSDAFLLFQQKVHLYFFFEINKMKVKLLTFS